MNSLSHLLVLVLIVFTVTAFNATAQDSPTWSQDFNEKVEWSFYKPKTSIYYVFVDNQIKAFDCIKKEMLWEIEAPGLKPESVILSEAYPYGWLSNMKTSKPGKRNVLFNPISGQVYFDSDNFEMDEMILRSALFDQQMILVNGKDGGNWVLGLAEFGADNWAWKIANPVKMKKMARPKLKRFLVNKDHLVIHFAKDIFSLDRKTGAVNWQKNAREMQHVAMISGKDFLRTDDPNFYHITRNADRYDLMAVNFESGESAWESPVPVQSGYSITTREDDIFIRDSKSFDFVSIADGKAQGIELPEFDQRLGKVFFRKDAYLVTTHSPKPTGVVSVNPEPTFMKLHWLNADYEKTWPKGLPISGKTIDRVEQIGDRLLVLSDNELALIEISTGEVILGWPVTKSPLLSVNKEAGAAMYMDTTSSTLRWINLEDGTQKTVVETVKFDYKKDQLDQPVGLKAVGDKFALIGTRNLWVMDKEGNIEVQKYVEAPNTFNWKKALLVVGGIAAGFIFDDELRQLNYELYESGLIDPDQYWNNAWAMGVYNKAGAAAVGGDYVSRLMPEKERNESAAFFQNKWFVSDKIDKGLFGLRIFDLSNGELIKALSLSKKENFEFEFDFRQKGVYLVKESALHFYAF
ncbi:MAG: PQQ-binding-like beta-propeller repeat protein [Bacteroidota bacterium]